MDATGLGVNESGTPDGSQGYWAYKPQGTGQGSGYVRVDMSTHGLDINLLLDSCYFHHTADYGIFPTNLGSGAGNLNLSVKTCLVGDIAVEDTPSWADALASTGGYQELAVIGCRASTAAMISNSSARAA